VTYSDASVLQGQQESLSSGARPSQSGAGAGVELCCSSATRRPASRCRSRMDGSRSWPETRTTPSKTQSSRNALLCGSIGC